jgi:hypothetical protein
VIRDVKYAEGSFAYAAMDRKIRAWTRDGEPRGEYRMQGMPSTPITTQVVAGVPYGYAGATDGSVYAFNLFTCGRIWNFPMGETPVGHIAVDSPRTPHVCAVGEKSGLLVLRVERIAKFEDDGVVRGPQGDIVRVLKPESAEEAWRYPAGRGIVSFSPETIYVGEDVVTDLTQRAYRKMAAIEKSGGRVLWRTNAANLNFFIEFHNDWLQADEHMRVYAVTSDNRLVSYKEKVVFGGPLTKPSDAQAKQASPLPASVLDDKKPEGEGGLLDN